MANWEVGIEDFFASPPPLPVFGKIIIHVKRKLIGDGNMVGTNDVMAEELAFNEQTTNFQQMHRCKTDTVSLFTRARSWLQELLSFVRLRVNKKTEFCKYNFTQLDTSQRTGSRRRFS